jgi:hypothetical protein
MLSTLFQFFAIFIAEEPFTISDITSLERDRNEGDSERDHNCKNGNNGSHCLFLSLL